MFKVIDLLMHVSFATIYTHTNEWVVEPNGRASILRHSEWGFNPTSYTPCPNVIMFFPCTNKYRERDREKHTYTYSIPHLFLHDYEYICSVLKIGRLGARPPGRLA